MIWWAVFLLCVSVLCGLKQWFSRRARWHRFLRSPAPLVVLDVKLREPSAGEDTHGHVYNRAAALVRMRHGLGR